MRTWISTAPLGVFCAMLESTQAVDPLSAKIVALGSLTTTLMPARRALYALQALHGMPRLQAPLLHVLSALQVKLTLTVIVRLRV